jgi:hypothetical protein
VSNNQLSQSQTHHPNHSTLSYTASQRTRLSTAEIDSGITEIQGSGTRKHRLRYKIHDAEFHYCFDFVLKAKVHLYTVLTSYYDILDISIVMRWASWLPWAWSTGCETCDVPNDDTPTKRIPNV